MDRRSVNKEEISAVRVKVEVETIADIPRTLSLKKTDVSVLLVVEIELPVSMFQELEGDERGDASIHQRMPHLEVRDDDVAISELSIRANLNRSFGFHPAER